MKSTKSVNAFRLRQHEAGGVTLYSTVDLETSAALETITYKRMCTKRSAIEQAIKRYAAELSRKR